MTTEPHEDFWGRYWWPLVAFVCVFAATIAVVGL